MNIRAQIIVRGKVHSGGYRYIIEEAAYTHHLTGRVGNQDDGTVRIICEGRKQDIQKFQKSIRLSDFMVQVRNMEVKFLPATGEFEYFDRIPDPDPSRATLERADAAARALRALDSHLSGKLDTGFGQVDTSIRRMDSHICKMDQNIKSMDSNIGGHFDKLDQKYDRFGSSLAQVADDIHTMKGDLRKVAAGREPSNP
jgi:acylphosphatase